MFGGGAQGWRLAMVFAGCLTSGSIVAAPASAETLIEALSDAYTSNPQLQAERARLRALDEAVPQASAGWKPTVTVTGTYGQEESVSKSTGFGKTTVETDPLTGAATISQPIFSGGRTLFGVLQAKAAVRAGRARLHSAEQQTLLSAVQAYFDVTRDQATVDLSKNNVNVLKRQLEAAQDRFRVGEITRTDVAQAEARLSGAETRLTAAEAQLTASRSAYERLIGRAPGTLEAEPALPALPASEEAALETALKRNPQVVGARETERASRNSVRVAYGALLPTLSVEGQLSHVEDSSSSGSQFDSESVTGQVRVPIYQAGREYSSVREAKQTNSQNRLDVAQATREVSEQVAVAWENLRSSEASIVSTEKQVRANEIAYEGVVQEAQVGSRTTLDVLDAEQELLDARVALVRSKRDRYVAAYGLLSASGQLTAEDLALPVKVYDETANARSLKWKQFWPGAGGN